MPKPLFFSDKYFWKNLARIATQAGRGVVEKALTLYFAAQRPETPFWAKSVIYSALAYLILPTDAIPDVTPMVGFADDLTTLVAALGVVAMAITPEVKEAASNKVIDWFGEPKTGFDVEFVPEEDAASDPIRVITID